MDLQNAVKIISEFIKEKMDDFYKKIYEDSSIELDKSSSPKIKISVPENQPNQINRLCVGELSLLHTSNIQLQIKTKFGQKYNADKSYTSIQYCSVLGNELKELFLDKDNHEYLRSKGFEYLTPISESINQDQEENPTFTLVLQTAYM